MNPMWNVLLGFTLAFGALIVARIKILAPGSPWHRRLGRVLVLVGTGVGIVMAKRFFNYQVPLPALSRGHSLGGLVALALLAAKFLAARGRLVPSGFLRPLGWTLVFALPIPAVGMIAPYMAQSLSWSPIMVGEVIRDPVHNAFDALCLRCHSREVALEGLGKRSAQDWIATVEPMAWAGGCERETTRGALAAVLAKGPRVTCSPAVEPAPPAGSLDDPLHPDAAASASPPPAP